MVFDPVWEKDKKEGKKKNGWAIKGTLLDIIKKLKRNKNETLPNESTILTFLFKKKIQKI